MNKLKILIVDDSEGIRASLEMILSNKYEILTATNGSEAEHLFEGHAFAGNPFDLVLTDSDMPVVGGVELISWIKTHYPNTPCILMSGGRDPLNHRADLFISKLDIPGTIEGVIADILKDKVTVPRTSS